MRRLLATFLFVLTAAGAVRAGAQETTTLAADQARAEERMAEVEQRLLALSGQLASDEPGQAARLSDALALSRGRFIVDTMSEAERSLKQGRLDEAARLQEQAAADLSALVALLGASDAAAELQRLQALETALADLLARQGEAAAAGTAQAQEGVRTAAEAVLAGVRGGPGAAALSAAVGHMAAAEQALTAGDRPAANTAQAEAERSLGDALTAVRAAVAGLAAQQRAAARARIARLLGAMAADQEAILTDTRAAADALGKEPASRAAQLAVGRLAAREQDVADRVAEASALADKAGGAALKPALEGVGADVGNCRDRLKAGDAGPDVQWLQEGIVAELKALQEAVGGEDKSPVGESEPGENEQGARPGRSPKDILGDLKIVRALQSAVQARTARLDALRQSGGAPLAKAGQAVAALGDRQAGVTAMLHALRGIAAPAMALGLAPVEGTSAQAQDMLKSALTGARAQDAQRRVVDGLDALIAAVGQQAVVASTASGEPAEAQSVRSGASSAVPIRPAEESMASPFGPPPGPIASGGPAAAAWLPGLPEAERKKVSDAFATGRLPARYRDLLREYNRRLAAGG
jgi:hypothetical protein